MTASCSAALDSTNAHAKVAAADAPQPMWHGITPTRLAADASLVAERCFLLGAANVQRCHAEPCDPAYLGRTEAVPRPLPFPCPSSRDRDHPVPMPAQEGAQVVWPVCVVSALSPRGSQGPANTGEFYFPNKAADLTLDEGTASLASSVYQADAGQSCSVHCRSQGRQCDEQVRQPP